MKYLVILLLSFCLVGCGGLNENEKEDEIDLIEEKKEIEKEEKYVEIKLSNGSIEKIGLEEYIIGVVSAEMPASFNLEALKSQAVAARTYAMYRQGKALEITQLNQVYITEDQMREKWGNDFVKYYNKVHEAVTSTKNIVMHYNDALIDALYFAISNGHTESAKDVFGVEIDYLQSVDSSFDVGLSNYERTIELELNEVIELLQVTNLDYNIIDKTVGQSIRTMKIDEKIFTGLEIRKILGLRSNDFEYIINGDKINITTRGYGHQVGMSQWGASYLASEGKNYEEILTHYYKYIKITQI